VVWVRCRDRDTRHEYDLHEDDARVRDGRVEVLTDYPPNEGRDPRPAKHRVDITGNPMPARRPRRKNTKPLEN